MLSSPENSVVLAYVPTANTHFCVKYLSTEMQLQVHTIMVNTGCYTSEELEEAEKQAYLHGARSHTVVDATQPYYDTLLRYFLYGNMRYPSGYPHSSSGAGLINALFVADHVRNTGAGFVAHGSSGNGSNQVRYDMIFHIQLPGMQILAPVRELKLSRRQVAQYMKEKGLEAGEYIKKRPLTYQRNIWGTTIGGPGYLSLNHWLPEESWDTIVTNKEPQLISIEFEKGDPVGLNGTYYEHFSDLGRELALLCEGYGIGRGIHVGDTLIGQKERFAYEAPVATLLIAAHEALEAQVLTPSQISQKMQAAATYARLMEEGHLLDPVVRDLEVMLEMSQRHVTGEVRLMLVPNSFQLYRVKSRYDLLYIQHKTADDINTNPGCDDIKNFGKIQSRISSAFYEVADRGKLD